MKQELKTPLEPITERFLEFVDNNGGPSEIARLVGGKPAFIYLLRSGKNRRPSLETLERMQQSFEHFDRQYVETGTPRIATITATASQKTETDMLRAELAAKEAMIDMLKKENDRVWAMLEIGRNTQQGGRRVKSFREATDLSPVRRYRNAHPMPLHDRFPVQAAPIGFVIGRRPNASVAQPRP